MPASQRYFGGTTLCEEFAELWSQNPSVNVFEFLSGHSNVAPAVLLNVLLIDQLHRWRRGSELRVEEYLEKCPIVAADDLLKWRLICGELFEVAWRNEIPDANDYARRFPEFSDKLYEKCSKGGIFHKGQIELESTRAAAAREFSEIAPGERQLGHEAFNEPKRIGRYLIQRTLGVGGFGRVYLGFDKDLERLVAIKVPREDQFATTEDEEQFIREARLLARLEHPGIVPVYDVGRDDAAGCFIVSKYIDGHDLTVSSASSRPTPTRTATIVAEVAEALHFAHSQRIIHRDIKPANILLDQSGRTYVADFGIALKDEDIGKGANIVGTVAYMSPEQIRGEAHLVDGRADVFSLGVVLYELLTGQRPFPSDYNERIAAMEARPPRQLTDALPRELERICLKALAKRTADRYTTAKDFAEDLRHWLGTDDVRVVDRQLSSTVIAPIPRPPDTVSLNIVPKGLRCFDADDADFFLELLPGPRDRDGLPEVVRFWKTRIEARDPERAFRTGLIYGPSGCGKSSLLRAGLLPLLDPSVDVVILDATHDDTELRLLQKLRGLWPSLPPNMSLTELLTALRRGHYLGAGKKLLIVLDQFEQWLHSRRTDSESELAEALRQCDGARIQSLIGVRDDFWMGITQFMHDLDVELAPGKNVAPMQLLNQRHARKVLIAFGRAFGALPDGELEQNQSSFVEKVIENLDDGHGIIPVRLALFAEMMKERNWHPETLAEIGGTDGIGVSFLENTFSSPSAIPEHRLHQAAARAVLASLLPEEAETIKGDMRSRQELLQISGYRDAPERFEKLLRMLDSDLRLITPTESISIEPDGSVDAPQASGARYYHLTHDYLVPPLREWLSRKQKESATGRAELRLAECAAAWKLRPDKRSLPGLYDWLTIMLLVGRLRRRQSELRRNMLRAATHYFVSRALLVATVLLTLFGATFFVLRRSQSRTLVQTLLTAQIDDVPPIARNIRGSAWWTHDKLASLARDPEALPNHRLRARMALLPDDPAEAPNLVDAVLECAPSELPTLLDWLHENSSALRQGAPLLEQNLWDELIHNSTPPHRRIRAGMALAKFNPQRLMSAQNPPEAEALTFLANQLVEDATNDPACVVIWSRALFAVRSALIGPLGDIFREDSPPESARRQMAAALLADYTRERSHDLVELLLDATPAQHRILTSRSTAWKGSDVVEDLLKRLGPIPENTDHQLLPRFLRRRAHARALLFLLGRSEFAMPMLRAEPDPTERTYLELRLSSLRAEPDELLRQLATANEPAVRTSLLRVLGGIERSSTHSELHAKYLAAFEHAYQYDADPGVHSAAEWALRQWGHDEIVAKLSNTLKSVDRRDARRWYMNLEGQTMAVYEGPITTKIGSPPDEAGRDSDEAQVTRRITRTFALSTKEVTVEQFLRFLPDFRHRGNETVGGDNCPAVGMAWYRAAQYCLWLSMTEGLPEDQWCYRPVDRSRTRLGRPEDVQLAGYVEPFPDYLTRTGYRLPSEVEWEYGCRAGSETPYSWGRDPVMADGYAWYIGNAKGINKPVGLLRPNDFGLFDAHGNVSEWTHNAYVEIRELAPLDDAEDLTPVIEDKILRAARGASSVEMLTYLRTANRTPLNPLTHPSFRLGFRLARTLPNR